MPSPMTARRDRPFNPLRNGQNSTAFTGVNGVPLGGIGAGCLEILPDGRLANFCTNNNRHRNDRIETMPGSYLAFAASDGERGCARFLQTTSTLPLGPTGGMLLLREGEIAYEGLYPRASLRYALPGSPVALSLTASGTVAPGNLELAAMPAALFTFTLTNTGARPAWGSVLFSWENIAGCLHGVFPAGRDGIRQVVADGALRGLEFVAPPGCRPNQAGAHALYVDAPADARVTAIRYNTWDASPMCKLEDAGAFAADDWDRFFFSESEFTGGLACRLDLAPGESREITFALAWHYPHYAIGTSEMAGRDAGVCDQGHLYANHFADVHAVARAALARRAEIAALITRWHKALLDSTLPDWLGRMLINNLYVLSPGTLWARDGRFSLMETPYGPMMGTLDQRFYSSVATALFFPELEQQELALFAITRHPQDRGRVYHDLGNLRFDDPKTGTTAKKWTDLNPKFVLMALRNYQWTNDRAEVERLWPYITEMMAYSRSQDADGDGLPNNEDRSTTYDDWAFFGANSYAAGLWVAALAAFRRLAQLLGREDDWQPYAALYELAARSFEERLWDEELGYYRLYNDDRNPVFRQAPKAAAAALTMADAAVNQGAVPAEVAGDHPTINRDCHDGQLAGQWYADLLGLGTLFDPGHIRRAVRQIARRNATPRGLRKGVTPDGAESPNPPSSRWWSEAGQGWPGYEVGHYAALAIHRGEVEEALSAVERVYQQLHVQGGLAWNQPLRWNLDSGHTYGWGCDRYMNSPAVWFVYLALTGLALNRPGQELSLHPRPIPGQTAIDLPLFTPGNWGRLRVTHAPTQTRYTLSFEHPEPVRLLRLPSPDTGGRATIDGIAAPYSTAPDGDDLMITFEEAILVGPAGISVAVRR